jgi:hypothetical protein
LKRPAISRFVAALVLGAVALVALAQEAITSRAPYWPALKGTPMLQEWYSDIPWHQKLGTFAGNEIDAPLILPYEALSGPERTFCTTHNMSPDDCMIELGINNILGMHRIETLYDPTDRRIANAPECKAPFQCTEVRLELSSFWTRSTGSAVALVPEPFGRRYDLGPMGDVYGGYQITDGSTYAPQMLWEMAHYCDSKFPSNGDTQDPVCYGDYLSPMNNGFNPLRDTNLAQWPRSQPWSIFPKSIVKTKAGIHRSNTGRCLSAGPGDLKFSAGACSTATGDHSLIECEIASDSYLCRDDTVECDRYCKCAF